ncbi:MAG: hypothetical protein HY721_27400 [Planctomycetes bacterium]|nr:hypothetical protein [Planctomycetota bacterium]
MRIEEPRALAVRDDFITQPGEVFFVAPGSPCVVLSSRGYGLLVEGAVIGDRQAKAEASLIDPDTLRVQAEGPLLKLRLLRGNPKDVLLRRAAAGAAKPAAALDVARWQDLREAVRQVLASSVSGGPGPGLRVLPGTEKELADRAAGIAPFLAGGAIAGSLRASPAPVFLECPAEREAWTALDEWLLGPDVLVAPVLEPGDRGREAYLPAGKWVDARAEPGAAPVEGSRRVEVHCPGGRPAVYVRCEAAGRHERLREALGR